MREWWKVRVQKVGAETRPDPILPVLSVRESPEALAGQLAFGGLTRDDLPLAQLPMFPHVEGPRVPLLELADIRGGPIMAKGRGAPSLFRSSTINPSRLPVPIGESESERDVLAIEELTRPFQEPARRRHPSGPRPELATLEHRGVKIAHAVTLGGNETAR